MSQPPPTPHPPPRGRYQLSLGSLLIATIFAALLMGLARHFHLEEHVLNAAARRSPAAVIMAYMFGFFLVGLVVYFSLQVASFWTHLDRFRTYSRQLAAHRSELMEWAEEAKAEKRKEREHEK